MITVSLEEMQRDLVGCLRLVQAGETLLVLEANVPFAEVKPIGAALAVLGPPRPFGLCAGEFVVPDNFDAPLPEEVLQDFERA